MTEDEVNNIHETALRVLQELGIKVFLPEAREILVAGGATLKDEMVYIGRDMVDASLQTATSRCLFMPEVVDRLLKVLKWWSCPSRIKSSSVNRLIRFTGYFFLLQIDKTPSQGDTPPPAPLSFRVCKA